MKQVKLAVYVLSGLTVLSFFLTWFTASASITISSEFGGGGSDSSESVIGLFSGQGFFALLLLAAAVYMFHKEMKFSYLPIVINILNGLTVLYVTTGVKFSTSSIAGSATSGLYPGVGVYLFMLVSTLLLGVLLVKEFKPDLFEKGGAIDKMSFLDAITNEYVLGGAILALELWCSNNISEFNSFSGFLIGALFFVAAPYYLAKLGKFTLVQNLILSHVPVYVLILIFGSLGLYNYEVAVKSVGENFFSITLIALVYEFVLRKKSDLIPEKARDFVQKLDLKKIVGILGVVVLLLFAKELFTSISNKEGTTQEENEATEEVIEEEAPAPSQEEEVVQEEEEEGSSYSEPSPEPAVEAAAAAPQKQAVQLYSIKDPDGYTNLRATAGGKIIRKVYENETFELVEAGETYSKIKLKDGTTGFLHNSRIAVAN
jgi:hypothetical protein